MKTTVCILALALVLVSGCVSNEKYRKEVERADALSAEGKACEENNRRLLGELQSSQQKTVQYQAEVKAAQAEIKATQDHNRRLDAELREGQAEIKRLKDERDQAARQAQAMRVEEETFQELNRRLKAEIKTDKIEIRQLKDRLSMSVANEILFREGHWEIHEKGKAVLNKVVPVLRSLKDKRIEVQGFTDNLPISPSLKKRFPSNWELSSARASTVVRYLQDHGVDPRILEACGFSEYQPAASNSTREGRAKNRRVEIVIVAKGR